MKIRICTLPIVDNCSVTINQFYSDSLIYLEIVFFNAKGQEINIIAPYRYLNEIENLLTTLSACSGTYAYLYDFVIDQISKLVNYPNLDKDLLTLNPEWPSHIESITISTFQGIEIHNVSYTNDSKHNDLYFFKKVPELPYYRASYNKIQSERVKQLISSLDHFGTVNDRNLLRQISSLIHFHEDTLPGIMSKKFNI